MYATLTDEQARDAIARGEFAPALVGAAPRTVMVLTQDWCPQWAAMKDWLADAADEAGVAVIVFEYNRSGVFEEFMRYKEDVWGNRQIPYLRYYREGVLVRESNYVSRDAFRANLAGMR